MEKLTRQVFQESLDLRQGMMDSPELHSFIISAVDISVRSLQAGGKILFCGNGGSAADAQHLAAELSGRFGYDRPPLAAEALHVNTSYLTAVANDYSFDLVYSRLVEALGRKGDVLLAFSTSGTSKNILNALSAARARGMTNIGFSGRTGGEMHQHCELLLKVPSDITARVQEIHITVGHIICQGIEEAMFPRSL
jgi:D-sedoheptulose 7-phosphate isomerase